MSENNLNSIQFFKNIKDKYPLRENGELDRTKIGEDFIERLGNTEEDEYIRGKIPEVYVSDRAKYQPLYDYYYHIKPTDKTTSTDKMLFKKLMAGDCSDMKPLSDLCQQMDYFGLIASPIVERYTKLKGGVSICGALEKLWKDNKVLPRSMQEEVEKYRNTYDQIIRKSGAFEYNNTSYTNCSDILQSQSIPEDERERIMFADKVCRYYHAVDLNSIRITQDDIEYAKREVERCQKELDEALAELERINNAPVKKEKSGLAKLFSSIIGKKQQTDAQEESEMINPNENVDNKRSKLEEAKRVVTKREEYAEMHHNITNGYKELIRNEIVPQIKEAIKKEGLGDQMDGFISYFFSEEALEAYGDDVLKIIGEKIKKAGDMPVSEYNGLFEYGLINIHGMANAFLRFEELEPKELIPTLSIIRDELIKNPVHRTEGKLSLTFRSHNPEKNTAFTELIPSSDWLAHYLSFKENGFEDLMNARSLDTYIKKVGILCYGVLQDFPYDEGNGRTVRMLMNILLAHRDIIIPSLYDSIDEKSKMLVKIDELTIEQKDYVTFGNFFLDKVREIGKDLSGEDRLKVPVEQAKKEEQKHQ